MGIFAFFHKIKMGFVRRAEPSIPSVSQAKQYGNDGEDEFIYRLHRSLPHCQIKKNILISTPEGNAEIDCLILYQSKLFAVEVKNWKGRITEQADGFVKEKNDRWTGDRYVTHLKSPFKQLKRAICLLRKQIPDYVWVNPVVFFANDELEEVRVSSGQTWFKDYNRLIAYIRNSGNSSIPRNAFSFFRKCIPADDLYANGWRNSLHCRILNLPLPDSSGHGLLQRERMISVHIEHHWSYDELFIELTDGTRQTLRLEHARITIDDNGRICEYALCKLDDIRIGRTLIS